MKAAVGGLSDHQISGDGKSIALTFQLKDGKTTTITLPTDSLGSIKQTLDIAEREAASTRDPSTMQESFHCIRTWAVGVHPEQDAILLIFDAETPKRSNYAITAAAARELGTSLTKRSAEKLGHGSAHHPRPA